MVRPAVVVITGGSSGIGRELAKNLAAKPCSKSGAEFRLVLVARKEEDLKSVVAECDKAAGKDGVAKYFVADVTKKSEVEAAADFAVKTFGFIDIWVNNAGRAVPKAAIDLTEADMQDMMAVNVYSALWGTQAAARVFATQVNSEHQRQVINVSSLLGRNAEMFQGGAGYNAAKHALNALTDNLRQDLQEKDATKDVVVTLFSPGVVNTPFGHNSGTGDHSKIDYAQPVAEVGEGLRECIEKKHNEFYSRQMYKKMIDDHITAKASHQA